MEENTTKNEKQEPKAKLTLGQFQKVPPPENFVKLSLGDTYFETFGKEQEQTKGWVVCLHGLSWASWSFHFLAPHLIQLGYRVLVFDFYGRGHSASLYVDYTPQLLVDQTVELLEKLKITSKFHLIGFSMGGCVATYYAHKFPERLSSLLLIGPAIVPVITPPLAKLITKPIIGPILFSLFGKKTMLNSLRTQPFVNDFLWPERIPELIQEMVQRVEWVLTTKPNGPYAIMSTMKNFPWDHGCVHLLDKVKENNIPFFVLWGKHDALIPFDHHKQILQVLPDAQVEEINGAHAVLFECTEESNQAIVNFLKNF